MKTLVFSDTHLTGHFEPKKFRFLEKIISESDEVIIAGDLWEGYILSFGEFLESQWNQLFPLLKEKKARYIFGNHDREEWSDERIALFSVDSGSEFPIVSGGKRFLVKHGHWPEREFETLKNQKFWHSLRFVYKMGVQLFGPRFYELDPYTWVQTRWLKELAGQIDHDVLICGHTHQPRIDMNLGYVNCGLVQFGHGYYVEVEDGNAMLRYERY